MAAPQARPLTSRRENQVSAAELLDRLRAAQGYKRAELLDAIEREYGRSFRKAVQEIVQPRAVR